MSASAISVGRKGDEGGVTEDGECPAHSHTNILTHKSLTIYSKTVYTTYLMKSINATVNEWYYNKSTNKNL